MAISPIDNLMRGMGMIQLIFLDINGPTEGLNPNLHLIASADFIC